MSQKKIFKDTSDIELGTGVKWSRDIIAIDSNEVYTFDFRRGNLEINNYKYNKRFRKSIIMLRYDINRHTNPSPPEYTGPYSGLTFNGPHIHIYNPDFNDKIAYPVSEIGILDSDDMIKVLKKFLEHCNVIECPNIQTSFF